MGYESMRLEDGVRDGMHTRILGLKQAHGLVRRADEFGGRHRELRVIVADRDFDQERFVLA